MAIFLLLQCWAFLRPAADIAAESTGKFQDHYRVPPSHQSPWSINFNSGVARRRYEPDKNSRSIASLLDVMPRRVFCG